MGVFTGDGEEVARAETESYLRTLAAFVQVISKGDAEIIESAGFEAAKHCGPVGLLGPVQEMTNNH